MKKFLSILFFTLPLCGWSTDGTSPIGEKAHYVVDTDASRTSSMITGGTMDAVVSSEVPNATVPSYQIDLNYDYQTGLFGEHTGTHPLQVPDDFFTPEFLPNLRASGTYDAPQWKMNYLGVEDATTLNGTQYLSCDKIYIYDIHDTQNTFLFEAAKAALTNSEDEEFTASSLTITDATVLVKYGLPVLGAVKIDMNGSYEGIDFKVGQDYVPQ